MANFSIEHFWVELYARMGIPVGAIDPRQLSTLLDQGQRYLYENMDESEMPGITSIEEIDIDVALDHTSQVDEMLVVSLKGDDSVFYASYAYKDGAAAANLERELADVLSVTYQEATAGNTGEYHHAKKVSFDRMNSFSTEKGGSDFYLTEEEGYSWAFDGRNLYLYPVEEIDAAATASLRIVARWYPERFIASDGSIKSAFTNLTTECELPAKYWPALVNWASAHLLEGQKGGDSASLNIRENELGIQRSGDNDARAQE